MKVPRILKKRSEKGQALIELAFGIVVMLILLTGLIELGRMLFQYIAFRDAAQEGASYASIYPTACNQTIARVRENLYNGDPAEVNVFVLINGVSCDVADSGDACHPNVVEVQIVQPNYPIEVPFLGGFLGSQTIRLDAHVTGTIIRPACP